MYKSTNDYTEFTYFHGKPIISHTHYCNLNTTFININGYTHSQWILTEIIGSGIILRITVDIINLFWQTFITQIYL